jgi:tRNA(Ile)-lysidine synthetase-like protein
LIKKEVLNQKFINNFCYKNLIYKKDQIIISLSGGVDSTVLFFLLKNYFSNKKQIHILIFDHQSRPESSIEIKNLINFYKIHKLYSYKIFKIGSKLTENNFQEKSRDLRIKKIISYAKKNKIKNIFFGHHYDDLLETLLLRKIQLSGVKGNLNIFSNSYEGFNFQRPLKIFKKKDIMDFANQNQIRWYEDRTNVENIYTRNKIRNYLIKKKNYLVLNNYFKSLRNIVSIESLLMSFITITKDSISIEKGLYDQLPLIIKKHLLYKVFLMMSPIDTIRSKNIENALLIISKSSNLEKKRSVKAGFIYLSHALIKFIQIQPFKQKKL